MKVSTGSETVPAALKRLKLCHDDLSQAALEISQISLPGLGPVGAGLAAKARAEATALWTTTGRLAYVHAEILRASGELDQSDVDLLKQYLSPEQQAKDNSLSIGDYVDEFAGAITETSARFGSFFGALGTWAARGGSFSDTYDEQYEQFKKDIKPIEDIATGATSIALGYIFRGVLGPAQLAEKIAGMPEDVRERYDAAGATLTSDEARLASATAATAFVEAGGKAVSDLIPKGKVGAVVSKLASLGDAELEAFGRGVGDIYGATLDAQLGHPESLDRVRSAAQQGSYGEVFRELMTDPQTLQEVIGTLDRVEPTAVHGTPADRDRPAYAPNGDVA